MKTGSAADLKNKVGKWGRWRRLLLLYILIFFLGLLAIELRVGPIWLGGRPVERVPSLAAAFTWIFRPEQMQYVAVSNLKMNYQLQRDDLTFNPKLDKALYDYLPRREDIADQYLKSDVAAGKPVLPKNLSRNPPIEPRSNSYVVGVRFTLQPTSAKFLEPESKI